LPGYSAGDRIKTSNARQLGSNWQAKIICDMRLPDISPILGIKVAATAMFVS
jgi:hypothetical protein